MTQLSQEEFEQKVAENNPHLEVIGEYSGWKKPIRLRCRKCGHEWELDKAFWLRKKRQCPKCPPEGHAWLNHDQFVAVLSEKLPDVEVLGHYERSKEHIAVRCKKCGHEWEPIGKSLLGGTGCPKCAFKAMGEKKRMGQDAFVERLAKISPDIEVTGEYRTSSDKIDVRCRVCGHEWRAKGGNLLNGTRCPVCSRKARDDAWRLDESEFLRRLEENLPGTKLVSKYQYWDGPGTMICPEGHKWELKHIGDALRTGGCPHCAVIARTRTQDEFVDELAEVNPDIEVIGTYKQIHEPIEVRCKVCGHEWTPEPNSILNAGQGCPKCRVKAAAERQASQGRKTFEKRLAKANPNVQALEEYHRSLSKLKVQCKICLNEWFATPHELLAGNGCPKCHEQSSFMERYIRYVVEELTGSTSLSRDRTLIGMELDIVLPDLQVAIEPGSWFYHTDKVERDYQKYEQCSKVGYNLLTVYTGIPNNAGSNIKIPADNVITSTIDLVYQNYDNDINQNVLSRICSFLNCDYNSLSQEKRKQLAYKAFIYPLELE